MLEKTLVPMKQFVPFLEETSADSSPAKKLAFVDNLLHFALKPENQDICP